MRLKAAQMRRELVASLNDEGNASERDAVNLMFVGLAREEIERNIRDEVYEGADDDTLDELAGRKEKAPEGSAGKIRNTGKTKALDNEDFFETLPDGEVVER
jgi:hypothetical protein